VKIASQTHAPSQRGRTLFTVCNYLWKFIGDVKLGETKDEIFVREIV